MVGTGAEFGFTNKIRLTGEAAGDSISYEEVFVTITETFRA